MAGRFGGRQRVMHQRGADAELAAGRIDRQRAQHQRREPPALTCHNRSVPTSRPSPLAHGREGEAFGGRASVAQALAGAQMAVVAKAGIEQRFTGSDVRGTLRCGSRTERRRG